MPKKTEVQKEKILRITWIRSAIGYSVKHKATIRALGLKRLHQTVELVDGPALRGMLLKVSHMVQVEEQVEK
jgi:large subunit ribosomal protein L30